jgi:hypothetical protein
MRSRIRWALLAVGAALNVSGVMDFSLRHSRNRVLLKRGQRLWPSTLSFAERAAREFRPVPQISKPALKSEVRIMVWIAVYVMALAAVLKRHQDGGCLHGQRISPVVQYRITPIKNWNWIIENGIRFTGMLGFGKVETPEHIWAS